MKKAFMIIMFTTISNVFSSEDLCPICLETINNDILILECNHQYHKNCINKWLRISQRCPMCQKAASYPAHFIKDPKMIKLINQGEILIQRLNLVNHQAGHSECRNDLILEIKKTISQAEEFCINQSKLDRENFIAAILIITTLLSLLAILLASLEA